MSRRRPDFIQVGNKLIRVIPEPLVPVRTHRPPSRYREKPTKIQRYHRRERGRQYYRSKTVSHLFLWFVIGFCACAIHPALTFLIWGWAVWKLVDSVLHPDG